jgi:mRNA interferase YafQ
MLRLRFTGAFKRDRKRAGRRGKTLDKLDDLMRRLASEEKLEARFGDHKLGGEWKDFRECHLEPDWRIGATSEQGCTTDQLSPEPRPT